MAAEPFLINPAKKRRRVRRRKKAVVVRARKRRRRTVILAPKTTRKYRRKKRRAAVRSKRKRVIYQVGPKTWTRRSPAKRKRAYLVNPVGQELLIAGANRPKRRRRRSYRRNPAVTLGGPMDIMKNVPYIMTGALAATATIAVPAMTGLGMTPMTKYGVQAAVALGGGMLVEQIAGRGHGSVWAITSGAVILADVLREYVFVPMGLLSDYDVNSLDQYNNEGEGPYEEEEPEVMEMSAFPGEMGAFPGELSDYHNEELVY